MFDQGHDWLNVVFLQNLKDVLADLIPKEQTRIKNFKQQYGKNNIGQVTVDMVSDSWDVGQNKQDYYICQGIRIKQEQPDSCDPLY